MIYPLKIICPPMDVWNTSWWGNPYADREAQKLTCDVHTQGPDGAALAFQIVFPACLVKRDSSLTTRLAAQQDYGLAKVPSAIWMVEPVKAASVGSQPVQIGISFPQEPTYRNADSTITVLPVASLWGTIRLPSGARGSVKATLPRCTSRPQGLGLFRYVVDAVTCEGSVEWD